MRRPYSKIPLLLILAAATAAGAGPHGISVAYHETLDRFDFSPAAADGVQKAADGRPALLSFDAMGRRFDITLEPNTAFLSVRTPVPLPDGFAIYRGSLNGADGSWARITLKDGMPSGLVFDGVDLYAIEAPGDSVVEAGVPVIYRLADTFIEPGAMTCAAGSISGDGDAVFQKLVGGVTMALQQGPGAVSEIEIGAIGDFEFTSEQGGDSAAAAEIISRLNLVDGIYSQEIGVQIVVPLVETFSDANDPFTDETDPGLFLDEVSGYRQGSPQQRSYGLTHLYTGRNLNGSTVGIAYNDVLCRSSVGAGLSEGNGTAVFDSLVAAHEIGHNFGAPHDGVPGACEDEPQTFIMAPSINGNNQFSQCSIDIMAANAAQAGCITALATIDMAVRLSGQPSAVLLGTTNNLTIDASNNGAATATNVTVTVTLPQQVAFQSATVANGSCAAGAGVVTCDLGDVQGLSTSAVTLTTTASAVGTGSFGVAVSTDFDERPGNNLAAQSLTVNPAVDLEVTGPSSRSVNIDQTSSVSMTVRNLSTLDASGVSLTATLTGGLRPDSAAWTGGSCTITGQQVDCTAASVGNQSSSTLTIGITALAAGSQSIAVAAGSAEADANTANNNASAAISVIDPDNPDDGGGAAGLPLLWLAGLLALRRARRRGTGSREAACPR